MHLLKSQSAFLIISNVGNRQDFNLYLDIIMMLLNYDETQDLNSLCLRLKRRENELMWLTIIPKYCIQLSAIKNKATMGSLTTVQVISEIIKRIKCSFGKERDEILKSVKENFQMEEDEKWVVTRLRMILFKMRGDIDLFQLIEGKNRNKLKNRSRQQSRRPNVLSKNKKQSTKTQKSQKKQVKPKRLSLEERQLNKLRQQTFQEDKSSKKALFGPSKLTYFKAHGLVPNVICL